MHRNESLMFCSESFELKKIKNKKLKTRETAPAGFGAALDLVSSEPAAQAMGCAIKNGPLTLNKIELI